MVMGCTIGVIRSIAIGADGSLLVPFLSPLAQMVSMVRILNRNDTFTNLSKVAYRHSLAKAIYHTFR